MSETAPERKEHTPGPWTVYEATRLPGVETLDGGTVVYDSDVQGESPEERLANAHLIAAAPDLLAALKGLARSDRCWCEMAIGNPMVRDHSTVCTSAYNAIAKAEGR